MPKTLVFIPMYNCEKQIPRVLSKFDAGYAAIFDEVLIVDNGSSDNSLAAVQKIMLDFKGAQKLTLVQNVDNYNLGGSHKVAFNYALDNGFDYVIVLHGDDQGDINDVVPYIQRGEHEPYDCFLGARFMRGSRLVNYSPMRIWGNRVFNWIFSAAAQRRLYDLGAGLNVYHRAFLEPCFYLRFPNALTFNYYMILYTVASGANFRFFPITWREEDQVSNVKLFRQTQRLLDVLRMYIFNRAHFMTAWHEPERGYEYRIIAETGK